MAFTLEYIHTYRNATTGREATLFNRREDGVFVITKRKVYGTEEDEEVDPRSYEGSEYEAIGAARADAIEHAKGWANERPTNTELLVRTMEYAKSGPLMQAFIIDALTKHAERVSKCDPKDMDTPMVSGEAWKACAVELRDILKKQYGE
jgi:hypothetical protein